jgi:hypothetical protein
MDESENPLILCVIHHRQNPIESTWIFRGGSGSNPDFVMDKSGAGAGFLRELRFPPANQHSICFSTIIFTITRCWHNRPGVAAVPVASQNQIIIKKYLDILKLPNPSSRTMALGVYWVSNRNEYWESSWGLKGGRRVGVTNLPSSVGRFSRKCRSLDPSHTYGPPQGSFAL